MLTTILVAALLVGASQQKAPTTVEAFGVGAVAAGLPGTGTSSSLQRTCYDISESSGPARPIITVEARSAGSAFRFESAGSVKTLAEIRAVEMVVMLFDVLGEHMANLRSLVIMDSSSGATIPVQQQWRTGESDARSYMTCIVFVRSVRLADGAVWRMNREAVFGEIGKIIPNLRKEVLDLEKPRRESQQDALSI